MTPTNAPKLYTDWDQAADLLASAARVIILAHVSPDGDAIGSMLGLGHALAGLGKQVTLAVDEGTPPYLAFLPGAASIRADLAGVAADLVIVVDCSDERRTGEVGKAARVLALPWINLDHHVTNTGFADANIMDPAFVSSSECVLRWLWRLDAPISPDCAQCLMCGLVTDTLCFRISAVTAETFKIAQHLMVAGANMPQIVQNTIARMPTSALWLWSKIMPTVKLEDHVTWVRMSLEAKREAAYDDSNDGGLVSWMLQAEDAHISCVLKEREGHAVEFSLRAKPGFDVSKVAFQLGGGGHTLASGATVSGTFEEVEARLLPLLKEAARTGALLYG
jgi:phosphoesterase RecJ-like protein